LRGRKDKQNLLFHSFQTEELVPQDHPIRAIKKMADSELARLTSKFTAAYSKDGRPSVPPETLIKSTLLQALFSIRSERQLCEQIKYNMMFRWFLDLKPADKVWSHSTFTKNRDRFADNGLMQAFFDGTVARAIQEDATSDEHFSVDGTLIQAYGSTKSFRPKGEQDDDSQDPPDNNGWADFKGEKRSNKTHQSTTDPEARLLKKGKGKEAKLCHMGNALMENRNSIIMGIEVNEANGYAEREATISMLKQLSKRHRKRPTALAEDAGYKGKGHTEDLKKRGVTQHIAGHKGRKPRGWKASQKCRKKIEKIFGWMKDVGRAGRSRFVGRWKTKLYFLMTGATYNLLRLANLGVE
jgi:transposase